MIICLRTAILLSLFFIENIHRSTITFPVPNGYRSTSDPRSWRDIYADYIVHAAAWNILKQRGQYHWWWIRFLVCDIKTIGLPSKNMFVLTITYCALILKFFVPVHGAIIGIFHNLYRHWLQFTRILFNGESHSEWNLLNV